MIGLIRDVQDVGIVRGPIVGIEEQQLFRVDGIGKRTLIGGLQARERVKRRRGRRQARADLPHADC